jgi:hypothetical protein
MQKLKSSRMETYRVGMKTQRAGMETYRAGMETRPYSRSAIVW